MATATTRTAKSTLVVPRRSGKKKEKRVKKWTPWQQQRFNTAMVAKMGDKQAIEQFVSDHCRWVAQIVSVVLRRNQELKRFREDLFHAGVVGLLVSLERWEPSRGNLPISLATDWIKREVQNEVRRLEPTITIPSSTLSYFRNGRRGGDWTAAAYHASGCVVLIDQPKSDDDDRRPEIASSVVDSETVCLRRECEAFLLILSPIERIVIRRRLGFGGGDSEKLKQIANSLGLSRERVRQVEKGALAKLRRHAGSGATGSLFDLKVAVIPRSSEK